MPVQVYLFVVSRPGVTPARRSGLGGPNGVRSARGMACFGRPFLWVCGEGEFGVSGGITLKRSGKVEPGTNSAWGRVTERGLTPKATGVSKAGGEGGGRLGASGCRAASCAEERGGFGSAAFCDRAGAKGVWPWRGSCGAGSCERQRAGARQAAERRAGAGVRGRAQRGGDVRGGAESCARLATKERSGAGAAGFGGELKVKVLIW